MISLVACGSSQMSPSVSCQEKGSRNKRKFRAEPPLGEPNKIISAPQLECLSYEFSAEKFEITPGHRQATGCDLCGVSQDHSDGLKLDLGLYSPGSSSEDGPSQSKEEPTTDDLNDAAWSALTQAQLEELVLSILDTIFRSAIKKIVACGYTEEVATKAILRPGICYGCKDTVSNIVDKTLAFLRNGQEIDTSREHGFEDLVHFEKFVLIELVSVLQEVRPLLSRGDAMWCLLICDMNVSHACAMDCGSLSSLGSNNTANGGSSSQAESQSKAEIKVPELSLPSPNKSILAGSHNSQSKKSFVAGIPSVNNSKSSQIFDGPPESEAASSGSDCIDKAFNTAETSQSPLMEEKSASVRKVHSSSTKRDYFLRQKSLHVEKSYRTYGSKGSSRGGKLNGLSGLILDKKLKSVSETSTINLKSASLQISKAMGIDVTQDNINANLSSNAGTSSPTAFNLDSSHAISKSTNTSYAVHAASTIPAFSNPTSLSATNTDLSLSLSSKIKPSTEPDCCNNESPNSMGIPYDKSLGQWIAQDGKDEMILKLIPRVGELQNQLQEWTEWANQKVMQAARRLSKDKAELQTLRQEKEEVERLKKEKQSLEENTMKKLSEMENALCKASEQVERANAAVRKLEVEKAALRKEMEAAKLRATETAASCQEVSRREKKTQMKFQTWEKQKCLFQEELMTEKRKLAQLLQESQQARMQQEQVEVLNENCYSLCSHGKGKISQARWQQEAKVKEELLLQASSIRKEREQIEESAKSKEDMVKLKAERNLQRYRDDIHKLEKEIAQLRLKTDSSKIAVMRMGIDGSYASRCADLKSGTALKEPQTSFTSELVIDYSVTGGVKRERECVMCLSEEMSVVFLPCAHQVVCTTCNDLHEKQGMQDCPSCRSLIQQRIAVRFPHT